MNQKFWWAQLYHRLMTKIGRWEWTETGLMSPHFTVKVVCPAFVWLSTLCLINQGLYVGFFRWGFEWALCWTLNTHAAKLLSNKRMINTIIYMYLSQLSILNVDVNSPQVSFPTLILVLPLTPFHAIDRCFLCGFVHTVSVYTHLTVITSYLYHQFV